MITHRFDDVSLSNAGLQFMMHESSVCRSVPCIVCVAAADIEILLEITHSFAGFRNESRVSAGIDDRVSEYPLYFCRLVVYLAMF